MSNTTIDRSLIAKALAKAIAYKQCGNDALANRWAALLVQQLECADILKPEVEAWVDGSYDVPPVLARKSA